MRLQAQEAILPPGDQAPILRLDVEGPLSYVSGLAFSPDGSRLYASGWDKVVHAWRLDGGKFVYSREDTVRIPVGGGLDGGINAIALSSDGKWLAVAGRGYARSISGVRDSGWVWPLVSMSPETRLDQGLIYVVHTGTGSTKLFRGHEGPVLSLAFIRRDDGSQALISAADEWDARGRVYQGKLRAWDVDSGQQLAIADKYPVRDASASGGWKWTAFPRPTWPPRLAGWTAGPNPRDLRVAVVWGDELEAGRGAVRVWEVSTGRMAVGAGPAATRSLLALPGGSQRFLTGGHRDLGTWSVGNTADGGLAGLAENRYQRGALLEPFQVAEAMALTPEGAAERLAAVVTTHPRPGEPSVYRYALRMFDLKSWRDVSPVIPLWSGPQRAPAIAAAAAGQYLAVAGGMDNVIRVFNTRQLQGPPQELQAAGVTIREAAFARKGDRLGLLLNERAPSGLGSIRSRVLAGDRLFDIEARTITAEVSGWTPVAPDTTGWRLVPTQKDGRVDISLTDPQNRTTTLRAEDDEALQELTAHALCPPTDICPVPLLAVAAHVRGEPRLVLYHAQTGEELRWLTGHSERIRSVAFSDDGKLLVSAAEDSTVCVWSLIDLAEKTLGRRGLFRGLTLHAGDGSLVVSASRDPQLRPGDRIEGIVSDGQVRRFEQAWEFYEYVNRRPPGERLTLQGTRSGNPLQVTLTVGQAIDERKPLFSLFVVPGRDGHTWDWIGWHPLGFYDARGGETEQRLGWHFNTGQPDSPARFAAAGEYREQNYTRDLLKTLLADRQPPPRRRQEPRMSLFLETEDGQVLKPDYDNPSHLLARTHALAALLEVNDFPLRDIAAVEFLLDGRTAGHFTRAEDADGLWTLDLKSVGFPKGAHDLSAVLVTGDRPPQRYVLAAPVTVRFQPAAPQLVTELANFSTVNAPQFTVRARVRGVSTSVSAVLIHRHQGRVVKQWSDAWKQRSEDFDIEQPLELLPGDNVLELHVRNDNPVEGYEFLEEDLLTRTITLKEARLPQVAGLGLAAISQGTDGDLVAPTPAREIVSLPTPQARLKGTITAPEGETLKRVEWAVFRRTAANGQRTLLAEFRAMAGFKPEATARLAEDVTLVPGRQIIALKAESSGGGVLHAELEAEFTPPLPRATDLRLERTLDEPLPNGARVADNVLVDGHHSRAVRLLAALSSADQLPDELKAAPVLNDAVLDDVPVAIDRERKTLSAELTVPPGQTSRLQFRLGLGERLGQASEAVLVRHVRLPRVVSIQAPAETAETPVSVSGEIASALKLESVEVRVNDQALPGSLVKIEGTAPEWRFTVAELPLDTSRRDHTIEVRARNADGEALLRGHAELRFTGKTTEQVEIVFDDPRQDRTVSTEQFTGRFRVDSQVDIEAVSVLLRGETLPLKTGLPSGTHSFQTPALVLKADQDNQFQVEVLTAGGVRVVKESPKLRLIEQPVRVIIEKLATSGDDPLMVPNEAEGDAVRFSRPLPTGYVTIHGRVEWPSPDDPRRAAVQGVSSYVNGFRYDYVPLDAAGRFVLAAVLSRANDNLVEIELPLPRESRRPHRFRLDCAKPQTDQRLHLLMVGIDVKDGAKLQEFAYNALSVQQEKNSGRLSALPTFKEVVPYGFRTGDGKVLPMTGNVDAQQVLTELRHMQRYFPARKRRNEELLNEVILIYYRGRDVLLEDGEFLLLTRENWDQPQLKSELDTRRLRTALNRLPGGRLVLVDVEGDRAAAERWPTDPHLGLFRVVVPRQDPPIPDDDRLLNAFANALAPPGTLKSVQNSEELRRLIARALLIDTQVPEPLADLQLGPPMLP